MNEMGLFIAWCGLSLKIQLSVTLHNKGYGVDITMDDKFNNPFFNAFILRNSEYMNYDLLYGDNKDILFINEDDCCTVSMRQVNNITGDTIFTPKQDELDLIKGAK